MIHIFHGFLGSTKDFLFLNRDIVKIHDLYSLKHYPEVKEDDTLVGYSLGGRIALNIADSINFSCKKIVLINAHPGLQSEDQKLLRIDFENKVMHEMRNKTKNDFLIWWNNLPIFKYDTPIEVSEEIFRASIPLFEKYRLSNQKNHLPEMIKNREKILYIAGLKDQTYMKISHELFKPGGIRVKEILCGHRAFQHQNELLNVLLEESVL